ncbi:LysM peptidoglycan-binding domain-containing protein [Aspergillus novofumigatus IBT 16806]|uniref:LysM domain-containing protein n=1 Tax=Aspergillus novofumigatus (strain IBT 16806) TaxID=1392255 RepID=A0A2I1CJU1_ASPN1|nr:uncharacterized protein P174DRAFT_415671 [Aspergillus novofumigatus IBT 16806]PKX97885.1 hypothetical protein P174DRAFT_415671 [Aspergillus novofumigatus IBT 16806]
MAVLSSLAFAAFALSVPHVAPRKASNTTLYYTVLEGDSIFSIAAKLGRGVCDITRANRMMDAEYLFLGFSLVMPDAVSNPDNDTCVLQAQNATATCIYGGRLDYTTAANDTISRVVFLSSPDEVLPANTYTNAPQCMRSVWTITAFEFTYGVCKDPEEIRYDSWADHHAELPLKLEFSCGNGRRRSPGATLPHYYAACWVQGVGR